MTIIASIAKNKRETLQVELAEFKGHKLIGLRIYVPAADGSGLKPTAKGVTLSIALLPAILAALQQAEQEAKRQGLIGGAHV